MGILLDSKLYDGDRVRVDIPTLCPYCRSQITPRKLCDYVLSNDNKDSHELAAFWTCNYCSRIFCETYNLTRLINTEYILGEKCNIVDANVDKTLPGHKKKIDIDKRINEVSNRFLPMLEDATLARSNNCINLAGMGYRNALECLVYDAALYFQIATKENLKGKSLVGMIDLFTLKHPEFTRAATKVRKLGNKFVHPEDRDDFTEEDLEVIEKFTIYSAHWVLLKLEDIDLQDDPSIAPSPQS